MSDLREILYELFESSDSPVVLAAYLFGSHARSEAHRQSDVEVAVLLDREHCAERLERSRFAVHLNTDLIAATHCNAIDVVVLNDASPELADRVISEGVRVFCRDEEVAFRFALQTRLRHIDLVPFLRRTRRLKAAALRS